MQWALDNWILILLGGGMAAMHLFGHGKHGGHGGGAGKNKTCCGACEKEPEPKSDASPAPAPKTVPNTGARRRNGEDA